MADHALLRTRPSRRGCNRTPSWAGSLIWSLGRITHVQNGFKIAFGIFGGITLLYIAGYFALVGKFGPFPRIGSKKGGYGTVYRVAFAKPIYEPLVHLDRRLFPSRWECTPEELERALQK